MTNRFNLFRYVLPNTFSISKSHLMGIVSVTLEIVISVRVMGTNSFEVTGVVVADIRLSVTLMFTGTC